MDTREQLLVTAERLIAREGTGVSMRRINVEAGQKNASALHYHFGSREALIDAILERRMSVVNRRRVIMVDELERNGRHEDLRAIVSCIVWPLAECVGATDGMAHYVQFLDKVYRDPAIDLTRIISRKYNDGLYRANKMIVNLLTGIPQEIMHARVDHTIAQLVHIMADIDENLSSLHKRVQSRAELDFQVHNFIDYVCGALRAPSSPETESALSRKLMASADVRAEQSA
ncbi:MAG: helix-turn-helix transcriptional regulator [Ectothiorhodospiraceae bacterium]|nr:helix-turn-helix transcriptional regulator [Ectothiorhodospiraceae bacterium]MCH8504953.1 TetR/AcrR family transcriptional regulator [Ectothiorhodospiraceae bacterium]